MNQQRKITQDEFDILYSQHREWLTDNKNSKPNFSNMDFRYIRFSEFTDLSCADLSCANLSGAHLSWARLLQANLSGAHLSGAHLFQANLYEADLSGADLSGADLSWASLFGARLFRAILSKANLSKAILSGANLSRAILSGADLSGANLSRAILSGANLSEADFSGVDFSGVDFDKIQSHKTDRLQKTFPDNNETSTLNQLKQELLELKSQKEKDSSAIDEKENEIEQLKTQLEQIGEEIKSGLESSFDTLSGANREIENEIKRLNNIFWGCMIFLFIMFVPLVLIWFTAFCDLRHAFELSKILLYTSPSLIILSFIFGAVVLMNRSQRQIVSLSKFMRKYSVIKIALKGYYSVQEKHLRTPQKAQEVFEAIIFENLKENIDTDKEEEKIQQIESKDRFLQKAVVDECLDALSKAKNVLK